MASLVDSFLSRLRSRRVAVPTKTLGTHGVAVFGGYVAGGEKSKELASHEARYRTYSEILADTSIVSAGVRYYLNLAAKANWTFSPSEADADGKFAELAEEMLTKDPLTPWHRIVRRLSMYRLYGFSVLEWTARRRDDGLLTFADVEPRAQRTIERWDVDETGRVVGVLQRSPQTQEEVYLPRAKIAYIVDDSLHDSPEGLGLFRHLVEPAGRLKRYEQLEGFGFETDLRGIPVGKGPFGALADLVKRGDLTEDQRQAIEKPMQEFITKHIKTPNIGLLLDSSTYESSDDAARPSNVPKWDIDLMRGSATSFKENAAAIERLNRELARVLGVDQLLLGSDSTGSYALSRDKTSNFRLLVDGALQEIRETVERDLLETLWQLNGWLPEMQPEVAIESVRTQDVEQIAAAFRDLAAAGAPLLPDDPAVPEIRALLGLSAPENTSGALELDANLSGEGEAGGS